MNKSSLIWTLAISAFSAALLGEYLTKKPAELKETPPEKIANSKHLSPLQQTSPPKAEHISTVASAAQSQPAQPIQISKLHEIAQLLKTNRPEDKFKAFKIAQECFSSKEKFIKSSNKIDVSTADALHLNRNAFRESELCGDITNTEILQRLIWLEHAAESGVPGSAQAYINATADRDVTPIPEQERNEKIRKFLVAGAHSGDFYSLIVLSNQYEFGLTGEPNQVLALAYYELAMEQAARIEKNFPDQATVLHRLRSGLSKEQLNEVQLIKSNLKKMAK